MKIKEWVSKNVHYIYVTTFIIALVVFAILSSKYTTKVNDEINGLNEEVIKLTEKNTDQTNILNKFKENSFIIINKQTLSNDMKTRFPQFSNKIATIIVDTVMEESGKYDINPIVLYALGIVESSHRYWIEHNKVTISVYGDDGKKHSVTTHAVGWGGVMWEYHSKMLKEKGIAEQRSDLFYPDVNIRATAAIYNKYMNMPLKKGTKHKDVSAQRRYFGGNFKSYSNKIKRQIVEIMVAELYKDEPTGSKNIKKENKQ